MTPGGAITVIVRKIILPDGLDVSRPSSIPRLDPNLHRRV
ncbi:hypothetical protein PF008_g22358 [Phytophthora fragariae]|uniref:Uncharacterized protein n=1 Tax=Phytophthora fragariae TaxID=53985 RepID=A0A6G0QTX9_9STRA|nr:hypothetical protein PF008_g22358 [Phytophthora fragariae]